MAYFNPQVYCGSICLLRRITKTMMLYLYLWLETNPPSNTDLFKLGIAAQEFLPSLIHFCGDIFIPDQLLQPNLLHKDF